MIKQDGKFYLYKHIRLDNNEVFYIGVGSKPLNPRNNTRSEIYKRAYLRSIRSSFWKNIISKSQFKVEIILESDDYNFIEQKEIEFIKFYGRKDLRLGTLVNLTDGGKGKRSVTYSPKSEETKRKISESNKKPKSEQHKLALSNSKLGKSYDHQYKIYFNKETGIFYKGVKEVAFSLNISKSVLEKKLYKYNEYKIITT